MLAAIRIELRPSSSIEPRATSSPMKHDDDSSPLIPENYPDDDEDLTLLALRSPGSHFFFFLVVYVLGDLVCVSVKFFFFLPLLVPVFSCSKNVEKKWEFRFWLEF